MYKLYLVAPALAILYTSIRIALVYKSFFEIKNAQKIPNTLLEFPVHITSQDEYLRSKLKVERFLSAATENQKTCLSLDQDDLNNLFYKGLSMNKSFPGAYFHYSIQDSCIIEKCIQWPSWFTLSAVYAETSYISFEDSKRPPNNAFGDSIGVPSATHRLTEQEGRKLDILSRDYPINYLSLFICIFDLGYLRLSRYVPNPESTEYRRSMIAIRNIDFIKIEDGRLIVQI